MKLRADVRLVELGLADSREKARSMIMAGLVYKNGQKLDKAGTFVPADDKIQVKESLNPFVSRGGLKLQKAITEYGLELTGKVAMDIGASTGGFTDCMLSHGAAKVYAIDVGYGQLDWRLRNDGRVVVMERTNARAMVPEWFEERPEFASIDVSFISVKLILPALYECLADEAEAVVLVKLQFEAGREKIGKNGVVKSEETHIEVLYSTMCFCKEKGYGIKHVDFSPITGPKGNIEFLLVLEKGGDIKNRKDAAEFERICIETVKAAHCSLDKKGGEIVHEESGN